MHQRSEPLNLTILQVRILIFAVLSTGEPQTLILVRQIPLEEVLLNF